MSPPKRPRRLTREHERLGKLIQQLGIKADGDGADLSASHFARPSTRSDGANMRPISDDDGAILSLRHRRNVSLRAGK